VAIECDIGHEIQGEHRTRFRDGAIGALAARQHGVVSRSQLAELGLGHGRSITA
jgi:hypothetical protein